VDQEWLAPVGPFQSSENDGEQEDDQICHFGAGLLAITLV